MGIEIDRAPSSGRRLADALFGVAGGLFASFQGFISPESFTLLDSIMILCMVVLGGMGNVFGVALGAVLLTALPPGCIDGPAAGNGEQPSFRIHGTTLYGPVRKGCEERFGDCAAHALRRAGDYDTSAFKPSHASSLVRLCR